MRTLMSHVYVIENKVSGKVYVGKTFDPKARWSQHQRLLRLGSHKNKHLQAAYGLYGREAFEFYLLDSFATELEVNIAEMFYIRWFRSLDLCYNHRSGGEA